MNWVLPKNAGGKYRHLVTDGEAAAWCGLVPLLGWQPEPAQPQWARCQKCVRLEAKVAVGILTTGLKAESHPSTSSTFELESWTETIDPRPSTSDKDKIPF